MSLISKGILPKKTLFVGIYNQPTLHAPKPQKSGFELRGIHTH